MSGNFNPHAAKPDRAGRGRRVLAQVRTRWTTRRAHMRTGKKRCSPLREGTFDWGHPPRTKVSSMAAKGFVYEVRMIHDHRRFGRPGSAPSGSAVDADLAGLFETINRTMTTRIVVGRTRREESVRIYLRTEQDLIQMRMITKPGQVFRVYRLIAPTETPVGPETSLTLETSLALETSLTLETSLALETSLTLETQLALDRLGSETPGS